ncbi:ACSS3 [Symbiodinium sp. CCMP2592]|nr:ACSS3 [Symbiodinium sp. CCMP2592]
MALFATVLGQLLLGAAASSMYLESMCRGQICETPQHPMLDYDPDEKKCVCRSHPCWDDSGLIHSCPDAAMPYLVFHYDQDLKLKCECATHPFFQSVYLSKHLCKDQFCRDEKFPILDYNDSTKECFCRAHPCWDMDGQTHSCPNDDFPVLRYREDKDEKTGETKTVCDCVKKMVPPKGQPQTLHQRQRAEREKRYWTSNVQKKATLEFTRDRKSMSVLCSEACGKMLYVKGAPESILLPGGPVELSAAGRQAIRSSFAALASEALRTLALAQRSSSEDILSSQLLRDPANFVQLKQPFVVQSFHSTCHGGLPAAKNRGQNARQVNLLHRPLAVFNAVRHISRERYSKLHQESIANPEGFWSRAAAEVSWSKPWSAVLDSSNPPFYRWFPGAQLNMCYNAVDRHVEAGRGGSDALIYDSPLAGVKKTFTYSELQREVSRTAGALAKLGIGKGDRVVIYMPMIPEAVFAMLACARLGAPHSVVFGGFAGPELATRLEDFQPKAIIWSSCGLEPKGPVEYQPMIKEALELVEMTPSVRICKQRPEAAAILDGDLDWDEALAAAEEVACEQVDATDPLYMLYTSGSTGKPKGVLRDTGGYAEPWLSGGGVSCAPELNGLRQVALKASMAQFMNMAPGEAYWAASDIGWVVGHSYIVYGPLLQGCATVLYEGKPIGTPDAGAFWRVVEEYQVRALFLAPTALRAIRRVDPDGALVRKYNLSCLRSLFVAGERSDPETSRFYASILNVGYYDNWWQTETGHPICGLQEDSVGRKDGSAGLPLFGYDVAVFDERGHIMEEPNHAGHLVVKLPLPPGTFPGLWNNDEGFLKSYLEEFPGYYNSGDSGVIDDHGYVSVLERILVGITHSE